MEKKEEGICEECKSKYNPVIEGIPLCSKCDEKNWVSADSKEGRELLAKDPVLQGIIGVRKHETDMPYCWCNPKKTVMENGAIHISHNE